MRIRRGWSAGTVLSVLAALVLPVSVVTASAAVPEGEKAVAPAPLVVEQIARGRQQESVKIAVKGPVQVDFRKITFPPGSTTGKHCHHGQVVAVVHQGTLTHYAPIYPGGVRRYAAGEIVTESSSYVHEGRNEGSEDLVLWVTYFTPEGEPLAETDLTKCHRA